LVARNSSAVLSKKTLLLGIWIVAVAIIGSVLFRYYDTSHHYYRGVFMLPVVNPQNSRFINIVTVQKISVDEEKKLRGVSLFIFKNREETSLPYQISLYTDDCRNFLSTAVVPANTYRFDDWNDFIFPVTQRQKEVCFSISPYKTDVDKNASWRVATDKDDQLLLIPIYLN
jgi:hypothetical protein